MTDLFIRRAVSVGTLGASLLLFGCGGGGGDSGGGSPPAATSVDVPITVVDGLIQNANVCLDKNSNGTCESDEPSGKTDASGKVTLKVDAADVGKYSVIAVVGTDATDADTGTVPVAFTLKAPADKPNVISPLTTLVQSAMLSKGMNSTDAESYVRKQMGLNVSLFDDFSHGSGADQKTAASIARLAVVTIQRQLNALAGAVGSAATDGNNITHADLNKVIQQHLITILPTLLAKANDPTVSSAADLQAKERALLVLANLLVADSGLTSTKVAQLVAENHKVKPSPITPSISDLSLSTPALTFLEQMPGTISRPQTVTLKNTGSKSLKIGFTYWLPSDFTFTKTCGDFLEAGASCDMTVSFAPTYYSSNGLASTRPYSITIVSGDLHTDVNINGLVAASPKPALQITPQSLTFGSQAVGVKSAAQTVTLTNTGDAPLDFTCIDTPKIDKPTDCYSFHPGNLSAPEDYSYSTTCIYHSDLTYPRIDGQITIIQPKANLAPGSSCTVSVSFKPSMAGERKGVLIVDSNAANGGNQVVRLNGNLDTTPTGNDKLSLLDNKLFTDGDTEIPLYWRLNASANTLTEWVFDPSDNSCYGTKAVFNSSGDRDTLINSFVFSGNNFSVTADDEVLNFQLTTNLPSSCENLVLAPAPAPAPKPAPKPAPTLTVSSVTPSSVTVNELSIFTVLGTNLPENLRLKLDCEGTMLPGGSSTKRQFSCEPFNTGLIKGTILTSENYYTHHVYYEFNIKVVATNAITKVEVTDDGPNSGSKRYISPGESFKLTAYGYNVDFSFKKDLSSEVKWGLDYNHPIGISVDSNGFVSTTSSFRPSLMGTTVYAYYTLNGVERFDSFDLFSKPSPF